MGDGRDKANSSIVCYTVCRDETPIELNFSGL